MTTYNDFKKAIDLCFKVNEKCDIAYSAGIDLIDSIFFDGLHQMATLYFKSHFNTVGVDWISWWFEEKENLEKGEDCAWDVDGTPIDLSSVEKLWEFLQDYLIENGEVETDENGDYKENFEFLKK